MEEKEKIIKKVKICRVISESDHNMIRLLFWFSIALFIFIMVKTNTPFMDLGPIQGWQMMYFIGLVSLFGLGYYATAMIMEGIRDWWKSR